MARYIDADNFIEHIKDLIEECENPDVATQPITYGTVLGLKGALSYAETLPTADVVEQKHGYWIKNQYISKVIGIPVKKEFVFICSLCGHNAIGKSKYCRECGADMRGAK